MPEETPSNEIFPDGIYPDGIYPDDVQPDALDEEDNWAYIPPPPTGVVHDLPPVMRLPKKWKKMIAYPHMYNPRYHFDDDPYHKYAFNQAETQQPL